MPRPTKQQSQEKALMRLFEDITKNDPNVADVAMIIACLGDIDPKALNTLKSSCESVDEFLSIASTRADISLTVAAIRAALGYDYEEVEQVYRRVPRHNEYGELIIDEVPAEKKVRKKHAKKNDALLKFLLVNRLPQYFSDSKKIEINKKTIEIKGTTEAEIRKFAGDLVKVIDSEFVDDKTSSNS